MSGLSIDFGREIAAAAADVSAHQEIDIVNGETSLDELLWATSGRAPSPREVQADALLAVSVPFTPLARGLLTFLLAAVLLPGAMPNVAFTTVRPTIYSDPAPAGRAPCLRATPMTWVLVASAVLALRHLFLLPGDRCNALVSHYRAG